MYIKGLDLDNFGKFHDKHIELSPGINVIYGENEAGKSTIHGFIQSMFFGTERLRGRGSGKDAYSRYQPWIQGKNYEGRMTFVHQGVNYRIVRGFYKEDERFLLINEDTNARVELPDGVLSDLIEGFTETNYKNSISMGQLSSKPDEQFSTALQSYMANLGMSGSEEVDLTQVFGDLKKQRKQVSESIPLKEIEALKGRIRSLGNRQGEKSQIQRQLAECEAKEALIKRQILQLEDELTEQNQEEQRERMEAVRLIQENNHIAAAYREKKRQFAALNAGHAEDEANGQLRTDLQAYDRDSKKLVEIESRQESQSEAYKGMWIRNLAILFPFVMAFVLALFSNRLFALETGTYIMLICGSCALVVVLFIILNLSTHRAGNRLHDLKLAQRQLERELDKVLDSYGVRDVEELRAAVYRGSQNRDKLAALRREMDQLRQQYNDLQIPLKPYIDKFGENITLDGDDGKVQREKAAALKETQEALIQQRERLNFTLEQIDGDEAERISLDEELAELEAKARAGYKEITAMDISTNTLKELSTDIHQNFGQELNQRVVDLFAQITDGSHQQLTVDDKFNISIDNGRQFIGVDQLSTGTMDQLYFALRMSAGELLYNGEEMPLILDDAFAFYDDRRLKLILQWLAGQGNRQIIIFSCHHREAAVLEEIHCPYHQVIL